MYLCINISLSSSFLLKVAAHVESQTIFKNLLYIQKLLAFWYWAKEKK